jgi:SAM-dependent methyltransferase
MSEIGAYNEALKSGQYEKPGGRRGKYDNVRRFWEDEEIGIYLRPYLERLVALGKKEARKLRILDLGCGSGDGYELLMNIRGSNRPIAEHSAAILSPRRLELYKGVDVNAALLAQAQAIHGRRENTVFVQADLNTYKLTEEPPYDLYLANYGTLSHNTDEATVALLSKIARHSRNGALILVDWLGRFSYEWQRLWTRDFDHNQWLDYVISYLHSGDKGNQEKLTHFPLRIMARSEALKVYREAKVRSERSIMLRKLADRSSFVGRHMDTARYNPHCQPLRRLVNSIFEPNVSTELDNLLIHYVPKAGFGEINAYYERLAGWWNYLVAFTQVGLEQRGLPSASERAPLVVRRARAAMKNILRVAARTRIGNPRASLVEPQLGYCLREIEMGLQKGLGCGHGLVAIFEVVK